MAKKRGDDGVDDSQIVETTDTVQRGRLRNRIQGETQHAQLLCEPPVSSTNGA